MGRNNCTSSSSSSDDSEDPLGDERSKPNEDGAFEDDFGSTGVVSRPSTHFTSPAFAATAMTSHAGSELPKKQLAKVFASGASKKRGLASSPIRSPTKKRRDIDAKKGPPDETGEATDTSPILFKYPMEQETSLWVEINEAQKQAVADRTGYLSSSMVDFQLLHNVSQCPLVLQHTFDVLFLGEVSDEQITFVKMLH